MKTWQVMLTEPEIRRIILVLEERRGIQDLEERPQEARDRRLFEKLAAALKRSRQGCGDLGE